MNGIETVNGERVLWVDASPAEGTSGLIGDSRVTELTSNGHYARTADHKTWQQATFHGVPGWLEVTP